MSRSDWLRELGQPSQAQAWWPHCHRLERLETLLGGRLGDWVQGRDAPTVAAALRLARSLRELPGRWQLDQAERTTSEALTGVRELRELLAGLVKESVS